MDDLESRLAEVEDKLATLQRAVSTLLLILERSGVLEKKTHEIRMP